MVISIEGWIVLGVAWVGCTLWAGMKGYESGFGEGIKQRVQLEAVKQTMKAWEDERKAKSLDEEKRDQRDHLGGPS